MRCFQSQSKTSDCLAIHPAVRQTLGGKRPRRAAATKSSAAPAPTTPPASTTAATESAPAPPPAVVPRYVPPKEKELDEVSDPRNSRHKVKRRLIVGNVSKWIECDQREDNATHKWLMYVRGDRDSPDVSDVVTKVKFMIHPSYYPHDLVEVSQPPFHLSRRGWGEFKARVQIHFKHDPPVDVLHQLTLDRTYTGLQTLGAETVVDVWLHAGPGGGGETETESEKASVTPSAASVGSDDESAKYGFVQSDSEGWVIAHSESTSMKRCSENAAQASNDDINAGKGIEAIFRDPLPDIFRGEKVKSTAARKQQQQPPVRKKVISLTQKENGVREVKHYEMNAGQLSAFTLQQHATKGAEGEMAPAAAAAAGPGQQQLLEESKERTTLVRCTDKEGKPFYMPVRILPRANHRKATRSPVPPANPVVSNGAANGAMSSPGGLRAQNSPTPGQTSLPVNGGLKPQKAATSTFGGVSILRPQRPPGASLLKKTFAPTVPTPSGPPAAESPSGSPHKSGKKRSPHLKIE